MLFKGIGERPRFYLCIFTVALIILFLYTIERKGLGSPKLAGWKLNLFRDQNLISINRFSFKRSKVKVTRPINAMQVGGITIFLKLACFTIMNE